MREDPELSYHLCHTSQGNEEDEGPRSGSGDKSKMSQHRFHFHEIKNGDPNCLNKKCLHPDCVNDNKRLTKPLILPMPGARGKLLRDKDYRMAYEIRPVLHQKKLTEEEEEKLNKNAVPPHLVVNKLLAMIEFK